MKIVILLITLFSFSLANDIASWSNFNFENIKFDLDKDVVEDFLQYEEKEEGAIVAIVNEYADKIFENIQKFAIANRLDPFNLTDIEEDFLASSVKLTKGHLDGIASIGRSDDITVSYSSDSKVMEAYFPIVFSNLSFTYDYHVIVLLIGPKGSIVGKVKDFKMNIGLSFDFNTYQAAVSEIKVTNKGHRISSWLIEHINNLVKLSHGKIPTNDFLSISLGNYRMVMSSKINHLLLIPL